MRTETWIVDASTAVSEVIDGELVVMNLASGNYFSGAGVGAAVWNCFRRGFSHEQVIAEVTALFEVDRPRLEADLDTFVQTLRGNGLVRLGEASADAEPIAGVASKLPYESPAITLYTDMKDLLMLDPIHDVADEGWPMRPTDRDAA